MYYFFLNITYSLLQLSHENNPARICEIDLI